MDARQVFEDAKRAAMRLPLVMAELDALEQAWRRGEWLCTGTNRAGHNDPTAARAAYNVGRAESLESERDALVQAVDEARALADGIGKLLGSQYVDALMHRYLEGRPWAQVAVLLGVSERTAYSRAAVALDTVDALGAARVLEGRGVATA